MAPGRGIAEAAIQRLYGDCAVAIADVVRPTYIGLAAETNLIRAAAPPAVNDAIVRMTADAVADLRARGNTTPVYVSVQVETAWGRLAGPAGTFVGIDENLRDFPFIGALGLSSHRISPASRTPRTFRTTPTVASSGPRRFR